MAKAAHLRIVETVEPAEPPAEFARPKPVEFSSGWDAPAPEQAAAPSFDARDLQGLLAEEFANRPRPPLKWVVVPVVLGCAAFWAGVIASFIAIFG